MKYIHRYYNYEFLVCISTWAYRVYLETMFSLHGFLIPVSSSSVNFYPGVSQVEGDEAVSLVAFAGPQGTACCSRSQLATVPARAEAALLHAEDCELYFV